MQSPVEETYRDVELMIHDVCHSFLRSRGISESDYEEWHAEASLSYTGSYDSYDSRKGGRFTTWLWNCIWYGLLEKQRREAKDFRTMQLRRGDLVQILDNRSVRCWNTKRLTRDRHLPAFDLHGLSQDAAAVVKIVLGTYGQVDGTESKPEEVRLALYGLLSGLGWSFKRIVESFHEIRCALLD